MNVKVDPVKIRQRLIRRLGPQMMKILDKAIAEYSRTTTDTVIDEDKLTRAVTTVVMDSIAQPDFLYYMCVVLFKDGKRFSDAKKT